MGKNKQNKSKNQNSQNSQNDQNNQNNQNNQGNQNKQKENNSAVEHFKQERPKGFMRNRFFAMIIDFAVITFLCWGSFELFGFPDWGRYLQMQEAVRDLSVSDPLVNERARLYQQCFLATLAIGAVYEILFLTVCKATIGKLLFGLRVVDAKENRTSLLQKLMLVFRSGLKVLSIYLLTGIPFAFLCLTAFGNQEGRSGFDLFSGTKVIIKKEER